MTASYRLKAIHGIDHTPYKKAARAILSRPFSSNASQRVLIYGYPDPICRSQIEPFFHHADTFRERFGAEFRCRDVADLLSGHDAIADVVLVQPWFTVDQSTLNVTLRRLRDKLPDAKIVFLDSYAHNDLRLGRIVDPYIDLYYKKSVFRDRTEYLRPRSGDTNLTDYYGSLCNIDVGLPRDWAVPETLLPKLRLSPNFFTHARFARQFQSGSMPQRQGRQIDLQSRLGASGSPWYSAMRQLARSRVEAIKNITCSPTGHLANRAFMAELSNSRLCFSPFGYGELCWRDIEAFMAGAVLIKPDMGHLETLPDLYEPGVTYLPVRWDFSDLESVIRSALADEATMARIAQEAWARVARYVREERFVDDMAELFTPLLVAA